MKVRKDLLFLIAVFCLSFLNNPVYAAEKAAPVTKVNLQLFWKHQFEFAGFYAALEKGYYQEAGLDVDILEYQQGINVNEEVLSGRADFGTASSSGLMDYLNGKPITILANIFKHSALVILAAQNAHIRLPKDLEGKRLMLTKHERTAVELLSFFEKSGIENDKLQIIDHTFDPTALSHGSTDAMSAYITNQPFILQERGIAYTILDPANYGDSYYGDSLFTSTKLAQNNPQRVKAFTESSIKGWRYALENPQEIIDLILKKYNTQNKSRKALQFEAREVYKLILPEIYVLGSIDKEKIRRTAEKMQELGMVKDIRDLKEFFFKHEDTVNIIQFFDEPPFTINHLLEKQGYLYELLEHLLESSGLRPNYIDGFSSYDSMLKALEKGDVDILTTLPTNYALPEDSNIVTSKSVLTTPFVLVAKSDVGPVSSIEDAFGKKVAVVKGYAQDYYLGKYPHVKKVHVTNNEEGFEALRSDKVQYYLNNRANSEYVLNKTFATDLKIVGQLSYQNFPPLSLSFAMHKKNKVLVSKLMNALEAIPSSEIKRIQEKWLLRSDESEGSIPLTEVEKIWLSEHQDLRLGVDPDWPPYDYIDVSGKHQGVSADVLALLGKRLGIKMAISPGLNWTQILEATKSRELDIISLMAKTPERAEFLTFTNPVIQAPLVIVTKNDFKQVSNLGDMIKDRVAMVKGYAVIGQSKNLFPSLTPHIVESPLAGLEQVSNGKVDAYVGNLGVVSYLIQDKGLVNLKIAAEAGVESQSFSIGVRSDWPDLVSILNKGLASITREEMNSIQQKWVPMGVTDSGSKRVVHLPYKQLVLYAIAIFLIITLLALVLINILKRENIAVNFGSKWFRVLVLTGLTLFILIVAFLGWLSLERNKSEHLEDIEEGLREGISITQERLDLWLKERISYMALLGSNPKLSALTERLLKVNPDKKSLLKSEELQNMRTFFKEGEDLFSNIGFFVIDPNHISIGSMRDTNIGTLNLISEQHPEILQDAFQGKVGFVPPITSDVHLDSSAKSDVKRKPPTMFFIGPVKDSDGRVMAVMTLRVNPWEDFTRAFKTFENKGGRESYAFDRNGVLLSASRFEDQLRSIGLLAEKQNSALNIDVRDPGDNMVKGYRPVIKRSQQPLTYMASHAVAIQQEMKKAGVLNGISQVEFNIEGYRDYRGVPVYGAWLWNANLDVGLAIEVDAHDALAHYYQTRITIFSILGFTLFLSAGAILFVLIIGERTSQALIKAKDDLKTKVRERTSELLKNQKQLTVAEERSRLLLDSVGEGIFGVDMNGNVMFINSAANSLLGYEADELIGKNVHEKTHHTRADGSNYPVESCPMAKAFTHGTTENISDEMLWRKDGTGFSVEYTATPILKGKDITGAVITFRDITERIDAERAIRDSEDRLTLAAEAGGLGMWEWRVDLDRSIVSDYWLQLKGLTRESYNQSVDQWDNGLHPDDKEQATGLLTAHLNGDTEHFEAEYRFKHPERGWYWEYANARVIERDKEGNPIRMVGYHQDISLRKKMEDALTAERERLQGILDTSPVGVAFSTKGVIHFANPRFLEMFDVTVGDPSPDLYVRPEERDKLIEKLTTDGRVTNYELQMYGHKKEVRDMLVNYMPINYDGEEGILGWLLDITDRKEAEKEVKEKLDEVERFNRLAMGREQKMIDLKKEINDLAAQLGQDQKYKIVK